MTTSVARALGGGGGLVATLLVLVAARAAESPPPGAVNAPAAVAPANLERVVPVVPAPAASPPAGDPNADTPPPSTYDLTRSRQGGGGEAVPSEEGPGLIAQLGRTLIALLVVVGLIYGIGRLLRSRLGAMRLVGGGGRVLRLRERLALDNRHALFVIDVEGGTSLIVGTGERGVSLVSTLDLPPVPPSEQSGSRFRDLLTKPAKVTAPESDKDSPHV